MTRALEMHELNLVRVIIHGAYQDLLVRQQRAVRVTASRQSGAKQSHLSGVD